MARSLAREAEELRPELIHGKLGVKPVPDGDHGRIIQWLTRICIQAGPELWVHDQGLRVETYRTGHARPDGVLAPADVFVGHGEWADAGPALMVVEVTSYDSDSDSDSDSDTDRRDRVEKPRAYAETGIPVYALIDRDSCEVIVHSVPDGVRYERSDRIPFGKAVELPAPVGIRLDTEPLMGWVR
ncbi:Uma2 family endonuclease [Streptomyces sp. AcH 505]|uniref:Uma2 family endonuclease n=1 Tax=Streptomyces sp. AcH 505 TaxID=352211 RepID=UPI000AF8F36D